MKHRLFVLLAVVLVLCDANEETTAQTTAEGGAASTTKASTGSTVTGGSTNDATGGSTGRSTEDATGGSTATTTLAPTTTAAPTTCTVTQALDEAFKRSGCNGDGDTCEIDIGKSIVYKCKDGKTTDDGPTLLASCAVDGVMANVTEWPTCRDATVCEGSAGSSSGSDGSSGSEDSVTSTSGDSATSTGDDSVTSTVATTTVESRRKRAADATSTSAATDSTTAAAEATGSTAVGGTGTGGTGSTGTAGTGETTADAVTTVAATTEKYIGPPLPGAGLKLKEDSGYTEAKPAAYQCTVSSHKMADTTVGLDASTGSFNLFCDKDGKWSSPTSWPVCVPPPGETTMGGPTTTIPPVPTTTTPKPLPPCQCLGDKVLTDVKANTLKVLDLCRSSKSRETETGVVPERFRCGSRTPQNATMEWNSYCNCTAKTGATAEAKNAFWTTIVLKNQNKRDRYETYDKNNGGNSLKDPKSKEFLELKRSIERAFDTAFVEETAALTKGFVKNVVFRFSKGPGCRDPVCATVATTTAAPSTTAVATEAAGTVADGTTGTGTDGTGTTGTGTGTTGTGSTVEGSTGTGGSTTTGGDTTAETTTAEAKRRKRDVTTATTEVPTTTYNAPSHFVQFTMETQFVDDTHIKTKDEFQALVAPVLDTGKVGDFQLNAEDVDEVQGKQEISFPDLPTCSNVNLTDVMASAMPTMTHNKPVNMMTYKDYYNETTINTNETGHDQYVMAGDEAWTNDTLELSVGGEIELTCKKGLEKPSRDWYDLDPVDGIVTAVCQPDGKYSVRATMLAMCITTCDAKNIPIPDKQAGLEYIGIKKAGSSRLTPKEKKDDVRQIWENDKLVYKCKEEQFGIMGGVDRQLDMYRCQKSGEYNTPAGVNVPDGVAPQPWQKCEPQRYMVINAVENMLHKYDQRLSNRYKIIKFQAEDAQKEIVNLSDHFTEVTIPAVAGMIVVIVIALLCSRNDSPICKVCESKA